MIKINGYTEEEVTGLIDYIKTGKEEGKTLSYLFEQYGKEHGRAKGSVRNYYYHLLKCRDNERVNKILEGSDLTVGEIRQFTEEETETLLNDILTERSKGVSVRRAISTISGGDEKLMLRMQNKYRNLLKKQPQRVAEAARRAGVPEEKSFLQRKLEKEIDELYTRIAFDLRAENARLREEIARLREEKGE